MVYKKYHKRGKKVFGPYYYESYRHKGKVKKFYIGGEKEYKAWLKRKKQGKKQKNSVEQRKKPYKEQKKLPKFLFYLFLMFLVFVIGLNLGHFFNVSSLTLTGFLISENVSEAELEYPLYAEYEEEIVIKEFDTEIIDLEIKEPPKFAGEIITKNKNKRMDFKLPEGNLILYFDLLNYSGFVEEIEEIIIEEEIEKAEIKKAEEEKEKRKKERKKRREAVEKEEELPEGKPEEIEEEPEKEKKEKKEKPEKEKSEKGAEEEEPEPEPESEPESGITGEIIKNIIGITARIIGLEIDENEKVNQTEINQIVQNISEEILLEDIQEEAGILADDEIRIITDASVIEAENFDIIVDETRFNKTKKTKPEYKWGYKVKLKDLNFMAKIDITSEEFISKIDDNTLKIGNNLLSFADLAEQGYTVRIGTPALEVEVKEVKKEKGVEEESEVTGEEDKKDKEREDKEEKQKKTKESESGITGGVIKRLADFAGLTGKVVETFGGSVEEEKVEDLKYGNTVVVYIEKDFNEYNELINKNKNPNPISETQETNNQITGNVISENSDDVNNSNIADDLINNINETINIEEPKISKIPEIDYEDADESGDVSVGDIIYLDPSLKTITFEDVTIGDLINITAEVNFTHLNISDTAPYDDLILYMPFDSNASTTTAYDYTDYNNDGDITNALYTDSGMYGGAMEFDADGDYVEVTSYLTSDNNTVSAFAWIKPSLFSDYAGIITNLNNSPDFPGWVLYVHGDNTVGTYLNSHRRSTKTLSQDAWAHVGFTYNGSDLNLYIDGVLNRSDSNVNYSGNIGFRIGRFDVDDSVGASHSFNGTIDEVMIFNASLTAAQISDIYNNQSARFKNPGYQGFANQSKLNISIGHSQVQVVGDYQAEQGSSINLTIGYYNTSWSYTDPQVFDGDNTFTISSQSTNLTLNFTFYAGNSSNPFYSPILSSNVNALTVNVSDTITPNITIIAPANNSNFNQSNVEFNISLNEEASWCGLSISGVANETMTLNSSLTGANYTNSSIADGSYTFIASCNDTGDNWDYSDTYYFLIDTGYPNITFEDPTPDNGSTQGNDNIFVNVSAADSNNISTFIDFDSSLVGWWRMDDVSGTTVIDYMGRYNGTATNSPVGQTSDGYFGKGFEFDGGGLAGNDAYIETGSTFKDVMLTRNFTISAWAKSFMINYTGQGGYGMVTFFYRTDGSSMVTLTALSTSGADAVWAAACKKPPNTPVQFNSDRTLVANEWVHLVLVNNDSTGRFYINGVLENSTNECGIPSFYTYQKNMDIGAFYASGSPNSEFNGTIDNVMIFNRTLSAEEITGLYANKSSEYLEKNFTGLADGSHAFKAYTQDLAGNVNYTEERTVTTEVGSNVSFCRTLSVANTIYTLQNDMNTSVDCLVIGANNITIDMNGYNITGDEDTGDYGIDNSIGDYANLTVYNGEIYDFGVGVYNEGNDGNITNITANSNTHGIYFSGSDNNILTNITANSNTNHGIYFSSSDNNILTDITLNSNDEYGIYLLSSLDNNLTGITANSNTLYGIYLAWVSDNNILTNITANSNTQNGIVLEESSANNNLTGITANSNIQYGIYLSKSSNNIFNEISIWNSSTGGGYSGIYLLESSNNRFTSGYVNQSDWACVEFDSPVSGSAASNNVFKDIWINNTVFSIYADPSLIGGDVINNTFLNVSYSASENLVSGVQIIRKWYYRAYVNDTLGNDVSGANVTAYNVTGVYNFNLTTGADGKTGTTEIIDYIRTGNADGGINTYSSPYNIYAINSTYFSKNQSYDVTVNENNLEHNFELSFGPNITVCGYTLDQANTVYTLQSDLSTTVDCLVIGAHNITIDMNGYNMTGDDGTGDYGISSDSYDNLTIYNGEIYDFNLGIFNIRGDNWNITNITANSNTNAGIYFTFNLNNTLTDITANSNDYGILLLVSFNNTLTDITANSSGNSGIYLSESPDNTLTNITINYNTYYGIYLDGSDRNNLTNINSNTGGEVIRLVGGSSNNNLNDITSNYNAYMVRLSGSSNNNLVDIKSTYSGYSAIQLESNSNNNNITDSTIVESAVTPVVILSGTNNIFLNTSYPGEGVASGCELIRKWYYRAYVNDTLGNDVVANVTARNSSGSAEFSEMTNSSGWTNITEITDYVNNGGTKSYYSPYTIYALNSSYFTKNVSYDVTVNENNLEHNFELSYGPNITQCGITLDVANTVYTLQNDMNTSGDCLVIGANNITIDMNGYNMTGDQSSGDYGIDNSGQYDNLTVYNGKIYDFNYGIYSSGSDCNITNIIANSNDYGIFLSTGSNNILTNITANLNTVVGIWLSQSSSNNILTNIIANLNDYGIYFESSSNNNFLTNMNISSNSYGVYLSSSNNRIVDSTISSSIYDIDVYPTDSINNTFLNTTYSLSKEHFRFYGGGPAVYSWFIRKWYYRANVTEYYAETPVSGVNVTAYNVSGDYMFNLTTDSLGDELVTNGGFDADSAWSTDFWVISSGYASTSTDGAILEPSSALDIVVGHTYKLVFTMGGDESDILAVSIGGESHNFEYESGIKTHSFTAVNTGNLIFEYSEDSGSEITVDDVSVKEVLKGYTPQTEIIDYINSGGTRTYYSNYTIYALNSSYFDENHGWNVTVEENTIDSFYLIKSRSNITLNSGWNLVSLNMHNNDSETDRNISLVAGWNLIGYSSEEVNLSLENAKFHDGTTGYTWAQALAGGKQQAYLSYYDTNAQANLSKYKYVSTLSGLDDDSLRSSKGYWIYSNVSGNLTLPSVGGTWSNETYDWDKLRFRNGSGVEKNISQAGSGGWLTTTLYYWDTDEDGYRYVCAKTFSEDPIHYDSKCLADSFNSWQGYFIKSNVDNITLIRQN